MISRKQRGIYLATGGAAAAAIVWLGYAKSAAGARSFLGRTGAKAGRSLNGIQRSLSTIRMRVDEVDRIVHELAQIGSEQKDRAEAVIQETLKRLEESTNTIRTSLAQSSEDISLLLKDVRAAVEHSLSSRPHRAA